ncbi:hypothetical protein [Pannonibacter tanglangensis]|uniref:Lysis protein n=1 Tax=Pannonibacter tanglangensis TaxID=2750084 RepID=A0ABW9ZI63_9HYPH|nr:hypothetical protein [Pannonibacter sp. XCT-34]NBN64119.1 hypothetical protein [Pannonibacter sp. XCT-34]
MRWDISLGNLLTIATVVVGLSAGWTQLKADQATIQRDQQRVEAALTARLAALEQERVQNVQSLTEMRADIRYMRQALERLETQLRSDPNKR